MNFYHLHLHLKTSFLSTCFGLMQNIVTFVWSIFPSYLMLSISALFFSISLSQPLLSHSHTNNTHRHTPPLSHAAILHNSNSAFISLLLLSPLSLSLSSLWFSFLLLAPSSCFRTTLFSPPFQICVASRTLHFLPTYLYLYSSCILTIPLLSLSFIYLSKWQSFHCEPARLAVCNPNIFSNPRKKGKRWPWRCLSDSRHKLYQCLFAQIHGFKTTSWNSVGDDWLLKESSKLNLGKQGFYLKRWPTNHRTGGNACSEHLALIKGVRATFDSNCMKSQVHVNLLKAAFCNSAWRWYFNLKNFNLLVNWIFLRIDFFYARYVSVHELSLLYLNIVHSS